MTRNPQLETIKNLSLPEGTDWDEEYAYTLGTQAYVYGYPWIYLSWLKWLWTTEGGKALAKQKGMTLPWAPINSWFHSRKPASPDTPAGGAPICDLLYSVAWADVSEEPIVVRVPEVTDRYYCIQLACIDSDNFGYIGLHTTGSKAGDYLIAGPGWQGEVPEGVSDILPRSRTNSILMFGRTGLVDGSEEDIAKANVIQEGYQITPLSAWPEIAPVKVGDLVDPHNMLNPTTDTEGAFIAMNRAMTENPPGLRPGIDQEELLRLFSTIGVGPQQRLDTQSEATLRGLRRAAKDGLPLLREMSKGRGVAINNWSYPPPTIGRSGQHSDFISRATVQALAGIAAHDASEAVYMNTSLDTNGDQLTVENTYAMTFANQEAFPPFDTTYKGFWSVTLYQSSDFNLPLGSQAYNVNSYNPEFASRDANGGMTIFLQRDEPENLGQDGRFWLQMPESGDFFLILRVYIPGPEVAFTQTWAAPGIVKIN